jgi:hypothetical protein
MMSLTLLPTFLRSEILSHLKHDAEAVFRLRQTCRKWNLDPYPRLPQTDERVPIKYFILLQRVRDVILGEISKFNMGNDSSENIKADLNYGFLLVVWDSGVIAIREDSFLEGIKKVSGEKTMTFHATFNHSYCGGEIETFYRNVERELEGIFQVRCELIFHGYRASYTKHQNRTTLMKTITVHLRKIS